MMDWNWFFSSLAQSSAAIVGILGAFLITKILNNQAAFLQKKSKCQEIIIDCQKVVDEANDRYFHWYNKHTNEREFDKLKNLLDSREEYLSPQEYYEKLSFSIFSSHQEVKDRIEREIDMHKKAKEKEWNDMSERAKAYQENNPGYVYVEAIHPKIDFPRNYSTIQSQLTEEFDLISSCLRNAKYQMRIASDMFKDIEQNPESSKLVNSILLFICFLFFFGVIYPLSFLPVKIGDINLTYDIDVILFYIFSIKGFFLSILSLIFIIALIALFRLNKSLRYSMNLITDLNKFKELSSYSEYFSIMEENEKLHITK